MFSFPLQRHILTSNSSCCTPSNQRFRCLLCLLFTATCRYNKSQIRTRNSVERAFGVWKRRFACLKTKLQTETDRSAAIITACAALHNVAHALREPCPDGQGPEPEASDDGPAGRDTQLGSRVRRHLIQRCFSSAQGNSSISIRGECTTFKLLFHKYRQSVLFFFLYQSFCAGYSNI